MLSNFVLNGQLILTSFGHLGIVKITFTLKAFLSHEELSEQKLQIPPADFAELVNLKLLQGKKCRKKARKIHFTNSVDREIEFGTKGAIEQKTD